MMIKGLLACRENTGLSRDEIGDELNIDNITDAKEALRSKLLDFEREKARRNARSSETALKAGEALVVPFLDFEVNV